MGGTRGSAYHLALKGQERLLADLRERLDAGDHQGARAALSQDIRFWRMALESADSLVSKMIAAAGLKKHFKYGSAILIGLRPEIAGELTPAEWQTPLSDAERSLQRVMAGEWRPASAPLRDADEPRETDPGLIDLLGYRLYQPQDTINQYAAHFEDAVSTWAVPIEQVDDVMRARKPVARSWSLYNPIGNQLAMLTARAYDSYAMRLADVEGVRRAALAAVTLHADGVDRPDVAAALASSPYRNPYDDAPFEWDERAGEIVFRGLAPDPRGEYRIPYRP